MAEAKKGMSIFLDVFRRADKNDDGALSLDEFKSFFADGVMNTQELEALFHEIDTHKTNNLDTGELCTYFSKHLGAFGEMFAAIEDLNKSLASALQSTSREYPKSSFVEQFCTRFLMREMLNQLSALQRPLEAASDHIETAAASNRGGISQAALEVPPGGTAVPGRIARRAKRQLSNQTYSAVVEGSSSLAAQVERLQELVDRLENRVNFEGITEEQVDIKDDKTMLLIHRVLNVGEGKDREFRASLRMYIEGANITDGCENISVRTYSGTSIFVLYELWECEEAWKNHLSRSLSKNFQHANIDFLEIPEVTKTMPIPRSWWRRD